MIQGTTSNLQWVISLELDIELELERVLNEFSDAVREEIDKTATTVARKGANELKKTSPKSKRVRSGTYASGWGVSTRGRSKVIHNKKNPGLPHLLEFGHLTRNGRSRTRAIPHIKPVEVKVNKEFEDELKRKIRSGLI